MVRATSVVLGIGLVILWIAGLSMPGAPGWLTWLDLVAAIGAFVVAGMIGPEAGRRRDRIVGPAVMATGPLVLWLLGLSVGTALGMAWWNFAFAVAFGLLAIFGGREKKVISTIEAPFRRTA